MRLLQRHYLREFLRLFLVIGLGLSLVLTILSLVSKLDDFLPHNPPFPSLAAYALLRLPLFLLYLLPVAGLICGLYTVGHAARTRETMAIMAAGGRMRELLKPFVAMGAALSLLGFALGELVVPRCASMARDIQSEITGEAAVPSLTRDGKLWIRAKDGSLVKIDFHLLDGGSRFREMSIFRIDSLKLKEIVHAGEAVYLEDEKTWLLKDVRKYNAEDGGLQVLDEMKYPYLGSPGALKSKERKPYEMGFFELKNYLKRLKAAGFRNVRLSVEMNAKLSAPLVSLFMVVLGISFSAKRSMGGLAATGVGLLVSLLYWLGYTLVLSLGYAGVLPPLVAAWLMPVFFGGASFYLFSRIPE